MIDAKQEQRLLDGLEKFLREGVACFQVLGIAAQAQIAGLAGELNERSERHRHRRRLDAIEVHEAELRVAGMRLEQRKAQDKAKRREKKRQAGRR